MPMIMAAGDVDIRDADLGPYELNISESATVYADHIRASAASLADTASLRLSNSQLAGSLDVTGGDLYLDTVRVGGDVDITGASWINIDGLEVDGSTGPNVTIDDTADALGHCRAVGITTGDVGAQSANTALALTELTDATIEITSYRAGTTAIIIDTCVGLDLDAKVYGSGNQADNTHPAIQITGAAAEINLRGSVRGGAPHNPGGNEPSHAVEVGASATAIDLWLAMTGLGTGTVDDNTTGEVTVH